MLLNLLSTGAVVAGRFVGALHFCVHFLIHLLIRGLDVCKFFSRFLISLSARFVVLSGFVILLLSFHGFAHHADAQAAGIKVSMNAKQERGYARIILDFKYLPKYESKVDDTILVFRFEEPVDLNFSELISSIPQYVSVARVDPDGRAFRLAFINNFKVNIMEAGTQVFIDILGVDWKGMPPNLPQEVVRAIAERAAQIEAANRARVLQEKKSKDIYKAQIRTGVLPTFSRLVFDWNKFVTADLERKGEVVNVTFGRPIKLDVGRIKHDLPKNLLDISSLTTDQKTIVSLKIPPKANVRGYREGDDYVVDISPSEVALSEQLKQLEKQVVDDEGNVVGREEVQILSSEAHKKVDEFSGGQDDIKMVRSTFSEFNPDKYDLKMFGDDADNVGLPALGAKKFDPSNFNNAVSRNDVVSQNNLDNNNIDPSQTTQIIRGQGPYLKDKDNSSEIYFPFDEAIASAGFIRGDTAWIIFETFKDIDLSNIMKSGSKFIKDIRKSRLNNGQLILIKLNEPMLFALEYENLVWTAKIGDMVTAKADALRLRRKVSPENKHYVSIALQRPSNIYWLKDDAIGDRIGIVTGFPPVEQLTKPQELVEFSTFGTAQGVVISPKTDDVDIQIGFQEVIISRHNGLHLSQEENKLKQTRVMKPKKANLESGFIDFGKWHSAGNGSFVDQMGGFESRISVAEDEEKKFEARRDYSRFLIANELAPEALGMLQRILTEKPERQNEPDIRVMQAAASVMMHRPQDALKSLSLGGLHTNEHASLWRGMAKIMLEQWSDALRQFRNGEHVLEYYPDVQRARFTLAAAEAAKNLKNFALMGQYLRDVPRESGEREVDTFNILMNAQYLAGLGKVDEAMGLYEIVERSDIEPAVAKARIDMLTLDLKQKKIEADDAIAKLEGMQMMWRGDSTEVEMMSLLSKLYADKGDYRRAFSNMKQAVKAYPADDDALLIQDDMAKVFKSLFLQNKKTDMRPIEALSLFYDYKELTPVGRAGDEMIRMLADRLIDMDLLDHAAELLDHQVTNRVHGAARSQVAAKLAMVHLMNRKPVLALQTIGRTRQPNLPDKVKRARDVLEARALSEMGRVEGAIDILNRMDGAEVERMKADAYWNAREWGKAGEQLEKILGTSWNKGEILQPFERKDVLRAAISYSLAEDAFALSRLRKKFYNKMVNSPDANPFIVVTKPVKKNGEAYKKLAKDIAAINTLDVFMKQYRTHYNDSLSSEKISSGPSEQEG